MNGTFNFFASRALSAFNHAGALFPIMFPVQVLVLVVVLASTSTTSPLSSCVHCVACAHVCPRGAVARGLLAPPAPPSQPNISDQRLPSVRCRIAHALHHILHAQPPALQPPALQPPALQPPALSAARARGMPVFFIGNSPLRNKRVNDCSVDVIAARAGLEAHCRRSRIV